MREAQGVAAPPAAPMRPMRAAAGSPCYRPGARRGAPPPLLCCRIECFVAASRCSHTMHGRHSRTLNVPLVLPAVRPGCCEHHARCPGHVAGGSAAAAPAARPLTPTPHDGAAARATACASPGSGERAPQRHRRVAANAGRLGADAICTTKNCLRASGGAPRSPGAVPAAAPPALPACHHPAHKCAWTARLDACGYGPATTAMV